MLKMGIKCEISQISEAFVKVSNGKKCGIVSFFLATNFYVKLLPEK